MRGERLRHTLRLCTILSASKRTQYYRDKKIFHSMGDNCLIMDRKVPLYARLISLGNNVQIASNVSFVTHDITHLMLNNMDNLSSQRDGGSYPERVGCILIGDNVFIGTGTNIMYNVQIGSNVVIGACSVVTHDIPDNCVAVGVPAKVICTFDEYLDKRNSEEINNDGIHSESVTTAAEERYWNFFVQHRNNNNR